MEERQRRTALVAAAIAVGLLSIGAGALIAVSDDAVERSSPSPASSGSPTLGPTSSPTSSPSSSPSVSVSPRPGVIEDGRHFVYVTDAARLEDGSVEVTFDLAYFLEGQEAAQAAAEHGDELTNDYYIVNDNPRLRTLPLAGDVRVRYIVADACCELQRGDLDVWLGAVLGTDHTVYAGEHAPWWVTVRGGVITRIEEQYLP
jgi:hypothetical protein